MRSLREHSAIVANDSSRAEGQFVWQPGDLSPVGNFWEDSNDFPNRSFPIRKEPSDSYPGDVEHHPEELENQLAHRKSKYNIPPPNPGYSSGWHNSTDDHSPLMRAHAAYKSASHAYFNSRLRAPGNNKGDHILLDKTNGVSGSSGISYGTSASDFHAMDAVVSHPTIKPMTLYRGFSQAIDTHKLQPGHEFIDHGYTGLSGKLNFSRSYGHDLNHISKSDPLKFARSMAAIHVPAGTRGHLLDHPHEPFTPLNDEHEFLLHRGTRFRVMGHSLFTGNPRGGGMLGGYDKTHVVHLQVTGQHPLPLKEHPDQEYNPSWTEKPWATK